MLFVEVGIAAMLVVPGKKQVLAHAVQTNDRELLLPPPPLLPLEVDETEDVMAAKAGC